LPFDYPTAGTRVPAVGTDKEPNMLKPYDVTINGYSTTLLLSDEDAKAQGLFKEAERVEAKKAPRAANKARRSPNKTQG
jgi:hypothetical protein